MSCCCQDIILNVIGNNVLATPTASSVVLTVDRPLTDMQVNGCFHLRVPKAFLKNVNANPVQLSDGATTLEVVTPCADALRYDSLVAEAARNPCRACLRLSMSRRAEPARLLCRECLPPSTWSAPATTENPAA